ncbi:hypothetical protein EDD21DRAFT_121906 [Dissophora ornata]|nr:hypothetical protein EDD21DRAFT_121906 [Dissophora ornata]
MMGSQDLKTLSVSSELPLSLEGLNLDDTAQGEELRVTARSQGISSGGSPGVVLSAAQAKFTTFPGTTGPTVDRLYSQVMAQLFLKRTLEASLLHNDECSYDYISYLNKISCPVSLVVHHIIFGPCGKMRSPMRPRDGIIAVIMFFVLFFCSFSFLYFGGFVPCPCL